VRPLTALLALLCLSGPTTARAQSPTFWGSSTTALRGFIRPADRDTATYLPFYEMVQLNARRLGVEGLSLHSSFWGLVDSIDLQDRYRVTGDLSTLYLHYRAPEEGRLRWLRGLDLTAGRQFVTLGPMMLEQIDGAKAHYVHSSGLEVGMFGGAPTGTRVAYQLWPSDEDRTNYGYSWLIGGRLGFIDLGHLAGGVSFVHRRYNGRIADNDLGLDASYSPLSLLDLSASAVLSIEALRAKEIRGAVSVQPIKPLSFNVAYLFSSPDLMLPRTSIFAVFADSSFQEGSLDVRWQVTRAFSLDADYGRRYYLARGGEATSDITGGANRAGARATLRFGRDLDGRALVEYQRLETPDNAADRVRAAASVPLQLWRRQLSLIVDLDLFVVDQAIRDTTVSFVGSGYVEVPLRGDLRLLAGGSGGVTPLLQRAGSLLVRLTWSFEAPSTGAVQVQRGRLQ
jgi:hypothetical protein